jgi:hypothetical protein
MEKELVDLIGDQFSKVHTKLDHLSEIKADKVDVHRLLEAVDTYAGKADTYFQEMVMLSHKLERHERWPKEIAERVGIELES